MSLLLEVPRGQALSGPIIRAREVVKVFGENRVLDGISLDVQEHEVVALIGASGSGKSTLLRCLNGLLPIEAGTITVADREVTRDEIDLNLLRREVGMVFQSYNLFPHMSVLQNITLAPRRVLGRSRSEAEEHALALLERIGLAEKARAYPDQLSGGQQQRVAIVRALAMGPRVLLLDEITSALDPELVASVLDLVRELASNGMTMLLATHEMGFAREVASTVCFLSAGTILESGPPSQIFGTPEQARTREFLSSIIEARRLG